MKKFQLIHVCPELGARSCTCTDESINADRTIPEEDKIKAFALNVGEKCLIHYGSDPIKTGNLIRLA
jgi:hypothetical protein